MANVTSYRVALFHKTINYGTLGKCWTMVQLLLRFSNNQHVWLIFYDPEKTDTVPTEDTTSDNAMIFIPRDQYPWHIDLLRNEHPIYYVNNGGNWSQGSLRTGNEDVGDGE